MVGASGISPAPAEFHAQHGAASSQRGGFNPLGGDTRLPPCLYPALGALVDICQQLSSLPFICLQASVS